MQNYTETIISEYANSPIILRLIDNFNAYIDPQASIEDFFNIVVNVATAQGFGLDIWGRIVGVGRVLNVPTGGKFFGFVEATNVSADPWNQSPFYSGAPLTSNFALTDSAFRTLIYAKALSNICNGSVLAINQVMLKLFPGRGNCYVTDNGDMTMIYRFMFALTPVEAAIIAQSGILPKPAGVQATAMQVTTAGTWGTAIWDGSTWAV